MKACLLLLLLLLGLLYPRVQLLTLCCPPCLLHAIAYLFKRPVSEIVSQPPCARGAQRTRPANLIEARAAQQMACRALVDVATRLAVSLVLLEKNCCSVLDQRVSCELKTYTVSYTKQTWQLDSQNSSSDVPILQREEKMQICTPYRTLSLFVASRFVMKLTNNRN